MGRGGCISASKASIREGGYSLSLEIIANPGLTAVEIETDLHTRRRDPHMERRHTLAVLPLHTACLSLHWGVLDGKIANVGVALSSGEVATSSLKSHLPILGPTTPTSPLLESNKINFPLIFNVSTYSPDVCTRV